MPNWLSAADRITELDPSELDGFSGAIIASPAPLHHISASPLLKARVPVLVEKPLADVPVNADTIIDASVRMNTPLMVGYTLRWYEPLQQLKSLVKAGTVGTPVHLSASVGSHLATWRPNMDYRSTVSAQRKLGGGALLELSHEIDYCLWLLGRPESVAASVRRSGVIEGDVEDMVDLQLSFADGIAASIHLDFTDDRIGVDVRWHLGAHVLGGHQMCDLPQSGPQRHVPPTAETIPRHGRRNGGRY